MAKSDAQWLRRFFAVRSVHYGIDVVTAALILTGQIQPAGMFLVSEGFSISFTGPVLGYKGTEATTPGAGFVMGGLEVITAVLLIARVFGTIGVYVTSHRASIVVGGPLFGSTPTIANLPGVPARVLNDYEALAMRHFGLQKANRGQHT